MSEQTTTPTSDEVRIRYELAVNGHWDSEANAEWAISSSLADIPMLLALLSAQAKELEGMRGALESAIVIAGEAAEEWDKAPEGMRAGKILLALAGHRKGYRADIDAIHEVRARAALKEKP